MLRPFCRARRLFVVPVAALAVLFAAWSASLQAAPAADAQTYNQAVDLAVQFLATSSQTPEGAFGSYPGPGVTAIVVTAMLRSGRGPDDPVVARSFKFLERFVQPDGGIYNPETLYQNYETCLAILAFQEANRDGRYKTLLAGAERFIKGEQWDETENIDQTNPAYGGAGYGRHQRPDLSNTQFLVEALKAVGSGADDPAMQKALTFVSRCQNLESEYNTLEFPRKNPDGGFYYTAAAGGQSMAPPLPNGGLRSYGSMTYAGLKSMIYAGVGADDPRVKAALAWIRKYYGVETNPGMGDAGLYYYYHTFAKALDAIGEPTVKDEAGAEHDWRKDLRDELLRRQRPNGSWVNENSRWLEGDPALVTGYALLALSYCRPDAQGAQ